MSGSHVAPAVLGLIGALALACGQGEGRAPGEQPQVTSTPAEARAPRATSTPPPGRPYAFGRSFYPDADALPPLDTSKATVPLDEIWFDTFRGGVVRLTEARPALIEELRDAIPPIYEPRYEDAEGGFWLDDDDLVIGYVGTGGSAYAYPHKILNLHEIVNDEIDGVPVLISYCPLCRSGIVYDRRVDGRTLTFGNTSALYESDLVMFDWETHTYWWQVAGRAIVGSEAGAALSPLPATTTTWAAWRALHPETYILALNLGFVRDYTQDPFANLTNAVDLGYHPAPVSAPPDERLRPSDEVLGVVVGDANAVYPLERLGSAAINEIVGGRRIVVFVEGERGAAFFAELDGRALEFRLEAGRFIDAETGSTWDLAGRAVAGPLAGAALEAPPSRVTFWFAYVGAFPDARLYVP